MENKTLEQLWEEFRIGNPNTVGGFQEQYESFKWLYNRLKGTNDSSISIQQNNMTAVDWLIEQLQAPCRGIPTHIIEQAKQMEKEQIETAYNAGREYGCTHDDPETGEEYYSETFQADGDKWYEVWSEGYSATGESCRASFHGKYFAPSFRDAVLQYIGEDEDRKKYFSEKDGVMRLWGCRFFDNEKDARAKFD